VKQTIIPGTDLGVSRFVFGTASLFNIGGSGKRNHLLNAVVDAGFTHFDTAPYYGFGLAERDLAPILKAHPHVTFTTKVGIYSPGGENQSAASVFARKAAGRFIKAISRPTIDFTLTRARKALEGSLKRSGRERIDIYTLHEPTVELVETAEWKRWLEDCVSSGKVRYYGLALTADRLAPFLAGSNDLGQVIQVCDSFEDREADLLTAHGLPMQITYGYVSAAFRHGTATSVPNILKAALKRNADGAVIVSTGKTSRLAQYAAIAQDA
jgi:aryl-alcohol dehydrogenase-like predicted oxidoreductase